MEAAPHVRTQRGAEALVRAHDVEAKAAPRREESDQLPGGRVSSQCRPG